MCVCMREKEIVREYVIGVFACVSMVDVHVCNICVIFYSYNFDM